LTEQSQIQVIIRVRPPNLKELKKYGNKYTNTIVCQDEKTINISDIIIAHSQEVQSAMKTFFT